jgi:UV DNA damage endonuclease
MVDRHHDSIDPNDFPQCWFKRTFTVKVEAKAKEVAVLGFLRGLAK